jgi:hypothetical protein
MARLSAALMLFGLLGYSLATALPYDQEQQNRDADCDVSNYPSCQRYHQS